MSSPGPPTETRPPEPQPHADGGDPAPAASADGGRGRAGGGGGYSAGGGASAGSGLIMLQVRVRVPPAEGALELSLPPTATPTDLVVEAMRCHPAVRDAVAPEPRVDGASASGGATSAPVFPGGEPPPAASHAPDSALRVFANGRALPPTEPLVRHGVRPFDVLDLVRCTAEPQQQQQQQEQQQPHNHGAPRILFADFLRGAGFPTAALARPRERGYAATRDALSHYIATIGFSPTAAARAAEVAAALAVASDAAAPLSPQNRTPQRPDAPAARGELQQSPAAAPLLLRIAQEDVAACERLMQSVRPREHATGGDFDVVGDRQRGSEDTRGLPEDPAEALVALFRVLKTAMAELADRTALVNPGVVRGEIPPAAGQASTAAVVVESPEAVQPRRELLALLGALAAALTSTTAAFATYIEGTSTVGEDNMATAAGRAGLGSTGPVPAATSRPSNPAEPRSEHDSRNLSGDSSSAPIRGAFAAWFAPLNGNGALDFLQMGMPRDPRSPTGPSTERTESHGHNSGGSHRATQGAEYHEQDHSMPHSGTNGTGLPHDSGTGPEIANAIPTMIIQAVRQFVETATTSNQEFTGMGLASPTTGATMQTDALAAHGARALPVALLSILRSISEENHDWDVGPSASESSTLIGAIRGMSNVLSDRVFSGDVSRQSIERVIRERVGRAAESYSQLLHSLAVARDLYSPERAPESSSALLPSVVQSRLVEICLLLFDPDCPDEEFAERSQEAVDNALGQFAYEVARPMRRGIDDALPVLGIVFAEMVRNLLGLSLNEHVVRNLMGGYVLPAYEMWRNHVEGARVQTPGNISDDPNAEPSRLHAGSQNMPASEMSIRVQHETTPARTDETMALPVQSPGDSAVDRGGEAVGDGRDRKVRAGNSAFDSGSSGNHEVTDRQDIRTSSEGGDEADALSEIADELIDEMAQDDGLIGNDDMDILAAELVEEVEPPAGARQIQRPVSDSARRHTPIAPFPTSLLVQPARGFPTTSVRSNDGLDDLLGMRGAARIRAILQNDSVRMSRSSHRTRLSRAYRGVKDPLEPINTKTAAAFSARAVRESAQSSGLHGAELDTITCHAGSDRMGGLLVEEMNSMIRSRLGSDQDFDPERYPAAARRFGATR